MRDPLVPAAQRLPCGFLDDGQFVIVSGKAADGVQAGEERDRGEHDFRAIVPARRYSRRHRNVPGMGGSEHPADVAICPDRVTGPPSQPWPYEEGSLCPW